MDKPIIEIDQIEDGHVVLVVPSLRLIVIGRTLEEARAWARSAMGTPAQPDVAPAAHEASSTAA